MSFDFILPISSRKFVVFFLIERKRNITKGNETKTAMSGGLDFYSFFTTNYNICDVISGHAQISKAVAFNAKTDNFFFTGPKNCFCYVVLD